MKNLKHHVTFHTDGNIEIGCRCGDFDEWLEFGNIWADAAGMSEDTRLTYAIMIRKFAYSINHPNRTRVFDSSPKPSWRCWNSNGICYEVFNKTGRPVGPSLTPQGTLNIPRILKSRRAPHHNDVNASVIMGLDQGVPRSSSTAPTESIAETISLNPKTQ